MKKERLFDPALTALTVIGALLGVIAIAAVIVRGPSTEAAEGDHAAAEAGEAARAHISLSEWAIGGDLELKPGATVFELHNDGTVAHNFSIVGVGTSEDVNSGASAEFDVSDLRAGTYEVVCAIAGHKEAGMRATLTVAENASGPTGESHGHGGEDTDWAALDQAMMDSILSFPAATEGLGNAVLEPTEVLADGTKVFDLTTEIVEWEVEPGRFVEAWTYNGIVPGPMLKLDVGDTIQVRVQNNLPMGTDIHWHGVDTPNNMDGVAPLTQPLIGPGETFTYEFTVDHVAVGMYHAHHHGQMQVPNGLFAAMLIGDVELPTGRTISGVTIPEDLEIAHEIPMVLNDAGVIGFSLNGKSFPATEPYAMKQGDWFLVHYFNEGLQIHPMHQHQFNGLVVAKDGIPLDNPYWVDTLNIAPGERYTVLAQAEDPGVWVWHCHILNHVEREEGMFGMVTALIVEEA